MAHDASTLRVPGTVFASAHPLVKLFDVGPDGRIRKSQGVPFSYGRAGRFDLVGATPEEILAQFGDLLGLLDAFQAIGLGVEKSGLPIVDVVTVRTAQDGDISRTLEHWHYPPGHGLFGVDLDSGRDFNGLAASVYPPWADIATLTRGSVSQGISNPETGETLEGSGEHNYSVIDELPLSKAAAEALDRLFWQAGLGYVLVAVDGSLHPRSPIDLKVYSPGARHLRGAARLSRRSSPPRGPASSGMAGSSSRASSSTTPTRGSPPPTCTRCSSWPAGIRPSRPRRRRRTQPGMPSGSPRASRRSTSGRHG